jgi:hypothetical protein
MIVNGHGARPPSLEPRRRACTDARAWVTDARAWVTDARAWVTDARAWVTDARAHEIAETHACVVSGGVRDSRQRKERPAQGVDRQGEEGVAHQQVSARRRPGSAGVH